MAQLTLYVEEQLLKKIESEAKKEKSSVSRWVTSKLAVVLNRSWPSSFLKLAGVLKDETFKRPDQGSFDKDSRKVKL